MQMKRKRAASKRRRRKQRTGAAVVEFAIVANVMFLMVLTCMEFARMNMIRNLAQDAAYYAARQAIVPGATADDAIETAESVMDSMINNGYTVTVSDVNTDASDVQVTVTVDFDEVALFAPRFMPNSTISTTANIRTERYDGFFEQQ